MKTTNSPRKGAITLFLSLFSILGFGQDSTQTESLDLFNLSLEDLLNIDVEDAPFRLYGFLNSNVEKVFNEPSIDGSGNTTTASAPMEWTPVKAYHLYAFADLNDRISILFNLAGSSSGMEVRNA